MRNADLILKFLARNTEGPLTAKEIAHSIRANRSTVSAALNRLAEEGKVRRVGEAFDGGRTWDLVTPDARPSVSEVDQ